MNLVEESSISDLGNDSFGRYLWNVNDYITKVEFKCYWQSLGLAHVTDVMPIGNKFFFSFVPDTY